MFRLVVTSVGCRRLIVVADQKKKRVDSIKEIFYHNHHHHHRSDWLISFDLLKARFLNIEQEREEFVLLSAAVWLLASPGASTIKPIQIEIKMEIGKR